MISDFFYRHSKLTAFIIVLLLTVIPGIAVYVGLKVLGDSPALNYAVLIYALILELIICINCDRFFYAVLPFVVIVVGVLLCEGVYLAAQVAVQSGGSGAVQFKMTSFGIVLFGSEFVGVVAGIVAYAVVSLIKSFFE